MKNSPSTNKRSSLIFCLALLAMFAFTLSSAAQPATSVNIVNNGSRAIRHVYASHVGADDWSADLISSPIASGGSATLSNVPCDQQQVRIIGENEDGCFVYTVVSCGSNSTWTITNNTTPDCGNQ